MTCSGNRTCLAFPRAELDLQKAVSREQTPVSIRNAERTRVTDVLVLKRTRHVLLLTKGPFLTVQDVYNLSTAQKAHTGFISYSTATMLGYSVLRYGQMWFGTEPMTDHLDHNRHSWKY